MKIVSVILACLLFVALASALTRPLGLSVARIDVQVAVAVFLAARFRTLEGAVGAFLAGYLVDALSGQPSGLYVFTAVLTFLAARLTAPFVEVRSAVAFVPLCAGLDLLHNLAAWGLIVAFSTGPGVSRDAMLSAVPASAGLTAVAALLIWPILRALEGLFQKPERGLL